MNNVNLSDDYDKEVVEIAKSKIRWHTCQIFNKGGKYGYKPIGSAILATIKNNDYLFSASHVISEISSENHGFIQTPLGFQLIIGEANESDISVNSKIDIAYIKLEKNLALLLKEAYIFLPENKILRNHIPLDTTQYLTLGFPASMIKKENGKVVTGCSFNLHSIMKERVYKIERYDESIHYLLNFAGKGTGLINNVKRQIIRDPHGMSGCGLWYISRTQGLKNLEYDYFLIGIMFYVEKSRFHYLVGNKINLLIDYL